MANNQDNKNFEETEETEGFEVSNQAQNLGGGKGETDVFAEGENRHPLGNDTGQFDDEDEFSKTDQEIAQAAPGQTANYTNQGGG